MHDLQCSSFQLLSDSLLFRWYTGWNATICSAFEGTCYIYISAALSLWVYGWKNTRVKFCVCFRIKFFSIISLFPWFFTMEQQNFSVITMTTVQHLQRLCCFHPLRAIHTRRHKVNSASIFNFNLFAKHFFFQQRNFSQYWFTLWTVYSLLLDRNKCRWEYEFSYLTARLEFLLSKFPLF